MEEEKWWAGEDRAPTLRPLLVRGQGNEICRKPKGIRKFRETLSHGCTANMICASLRSGGRRLAVRTVMEHPIGALTRTPFASSRRSPQGETRDMREKTASHILHVPFRWFPPFGGWRHHLYPKGSVSLDFRVAVLPYKSSSLATPQAGALWMLSHGAMSLQESMERPILPPA